MPHSQVFNRIQVSGNLPTAKGPALKVLELTRNESVSMAQLAQALKPDATLVARMIKLANTCRATGGRPILAIQEAIGMLGINAVKGLALGFSLIDGSRTGQCAAFDYPGFWARNLARAVAMQELAGVARFMPRDDAFTLGLLARMGELALANSFPQEYATILTDNPRGSAERLQREMAAFGSDHADLTAEMLVDWTFPEVLASAVRFHVKPDTAGFASQSREEKILQALALASALADVCFAGKQQQPGLLSALLLQAGRLALPPDTLIELADRTVAGWSDWCELFKVPVQAAPSFAALAKEIESPYRADFEELEPGGEPLRVLVVEDERSMRMLLRVLAEKLGHTCIDAENGRIGLELALRERPQLAVVDWNMPEMNGIDMIRALRNDPAGRRIYVLILTAQGDEDRLAEAFSAGADDFLTKPLRPRELAARMRAGQRMIGLLREIEADRATLKKFATEFADLNRRLDEHQPDQNPQNPGTETPATNSVATP